MAKRTAGPQKEDALHRRQLGVYTHLFGQPAFSAFRQPIGVDCVEQVTTYLIATSTILSGVASTSVTASVPAVTVTNTQTSTVTSLISSSLVTVTETETVNVPKGGVFTDSVLCTSTDTLPSTSTTTQDIKCAPTNLISSVGGEGIGSIMTQNETSGLSAGSDASACCQLCVDTEGCAASADDPAAGNCFLYYTTPSCGLGFTYSNGSQNIAAGQGFLVQTGCGTIMSA